MGAVETIALTMGVGWASGLNLYAAVFVLGLLERLDYLSLPPDLMVLSDPLVLFAAGFMYVVEFFADKIPGVDTAWDAVHTFIRIPAGAVLAAQAVGDVSEPAMLAAGLLGGTLAAGSHAVKAGTRVAINASPEPVSNWAASVGEDVAVVGGLWAAFAHPWLFLVALALFLALGIWLLPRIARGLRRLFRALRARRAGPEAAGEARSASSADPPSW